MRRRNSTYEWVLAHVWMSHVIHMNESCHMHEWVMSHIWMSRVTHMNESRRPYVRVQKWYVHICKHIHTRTYMQTYTHTHTYICRGGFCYGMGVRKRMCCIYMSSRVSCHVGVSKSYVSMCEKDNMYLCVRKRHVSICEKENMLYVFQVKRTPCMSFKYVFQVKHMFLCVRKRTCCISFK